MKKYNEFLNESELFPMIAEVWQGSESTTLIPANDPNKMKIVDADAVLIRTIEGKDWEDCCRQHYELMGWEPYKPWNDETE